jgi:lysophospholipase L1-like esterase
VSDRIVPGVRYLLPVFVLVGLAGGVALAEVWIAWRDPGLVSRDASGDEGLHFYRFHPDVGLFHKPGFTGEHGGVVYETNPKGLRGPMVDTERVPGRGRVVLLGDSLVWGFGVSEGESLADAIASVRPGVDVLNFGVAGFGTGQELMLLEAEALAYAPDRVVLVFTLANDVEDSFYPDSAASYPANIFHLVDGELRIDRFSLSPWARLGLWLRHNSYLVALVAQSRGREGGAANSVGESSVGKSNLGRLHATDFEGRAFAGRLSYLDHPALEVRHQARRGGLLAPTAANHYKVELVKALIREMARVTHAAGAELSVALAPFRAQLGGDPVLRANPLTAELRRFLEAEGIEHLDLLPVFIDSGVPVARIFFDGMHFSAEGNRMAGREIAEAWIPAGVYDSEADRSGTEPLD